MAKMKEKDKMKFWPLRLPPDLYALVKRKGYRAAAWVRAAMYEQIKRGIK